VLFRSLKNLRGTPILGVGIEIEGTVVKENSRIKAPVEDAGTRKVQSPSLKGKSRNRIPTVKSKEVEA
jgi:hypothetical protein